MVLQSPQGWDRVQLILFSLLLESSSLGSLIPELWGKVLLPEDEGQEGTQPVTGQ
jgi:hypothetical protein